MSLTLPDFRERKCLDVSFCGRVLEEERQGIVLPGELKKSRIARYEGAGKEIFMGLVRPFPNAEMHVHLSFAVRERFGKVVPEVDATPEDLLDLVAPFLGKRFDARLSGMFRVPKDVLPPFIRDAAVSTIADAVEVQMTGATLAVRGAPIESISWEIRSSGVVDIFLEARNRSRFDTSYLDDGLDLLEAAFRAFIVKEARNE